MTGAFGFTADEVEAVRLSLRVAFWAMLCSLPFGLCDGNAAGARAGSGARAWSTASCTCRWSCRRSSPAICCCCCSAARGRSDGSSRTPSASSLRFAGPAPRSPAAVMGFPLMVRAIRLSLDAVDRRLEEAAGTLGAGRVFVFLLITLPLIDAGDRCRHGAVLRPQPRRVRRHDHLRLQHPGRDPDPAARRSTR